MKKHWLISAALLTLASTGAWAQTAAPAPAAAPAAPAATASSTPDAGGGRHHTRTLEEARK